MSSLNKSFHSSSSFKEEVMVSKQQGIVSILGSDSELKTNKPLRRTLSADMSSKKWLSQNGFSSRLKKIASSKEFSVSIITDSSSSEGDEDEYEKETEVWSSIQQEKQKKDSSPRGQFDIWSSILTQKAQEAKNLLPPPYVHPLVKRSASSLSEKSLEICTESLGSETGSDGFSSYPPSETGDAEEDKEEEQQEEEEEEEEEEEKVSKNYDMEDWQVIKCNITAASKKLPPRTFPPPIPSLSSRDGASLRMRPRRDNGRFVLEAISVPSQNNFKAERQDGRLVLSFIDTPDGEEEGTKKNEMELFQVEIEDSEEEEEEVNERGGGGGGGEEMRYVMEQAPKLSGGIINVHRLALMINKPTMLANRNTAWSNKFNEVVKFEEEEEEEEEVNPNPIAPLTQSLPPRPPVGRSIPKPAAVATAATASVNAYEYYWKPKPMGTAGVTACLSPIAKKSPSNNDKYILTKNLIVNEKRQELSVWSGNKGDCFPPLSKGCKEPRRSLLLQKLHCIATS
ncbi:hypothetical protein JCGZ_23902 [Jatropha curcas]|uniref:FAF domain-containing protein n=1 Tax=Jatropha curcas TaxID=180498 RepID=A0A067LEM2_JATCU|nr:protein FAF-like, chloroplastic [Jatropha curcas]KDP42960.1 hypothetical protein JCGZ_23902 [Jatropha curcas]